MGPRGKDRRVILKKVGPDFPGETFRILKEKEGCAVEGRGCKYAFDWRALHEVVFEALGLTKEEQLEVYREVASLVKNRFVKARSV